ncbi:MAG: cadmium-translocating P-type ATPase [Proteobacteria bacterium]|nr:cadmium-translocating P-type ATPase [Pseudomonadota bacterium]
MNLSRLKNFGTYEWLAIVTCVAIALHLLLSHSPEPFLWYADYPLWLTILVGGMPLLFGILRKLWKRDFGADFLAAIALVTAVVLEEYLAASLIILMLSGGQALEVYAMRKASSVLAALSERMPAIAHRKKGDAVEEIALSDVKVGDLIMVYPHEASPVDGVVVEGHSTMDESYLTGEPYKISKAPGASVLSGAVNGDTMLVIAAEKLAADSRYAAIMKVMQDAEQKRPKLRRLADQIGSVFAPLALAFAGVTWIITGDEVRFLSVLVVATPCPLLIAIPVAIISAISIAARHGIIIKDPSVLERLPTCTTAIFDKTGTLTYGQPEYTQMHLATGFTEEEVLKAVASLERYSKHPLAGAIVKAAEKRQLTLPPVEQVSERPGEGLHGRVQGRKIHVTHRKYIQRKAEHLVKELPPVAAGLECIVLIDDAFAASMQFRDKPREDGKPFIKHLSPAHQFDRVILLSGDRANEVEYLAKIMGIKETYSAQSPEQKLEIVRGESAKAPTLFMGDGINDAPALTAATVGLAFGQNHAVTGESAGAVIMDNTLEKVDELIHLSSSLRNIALQSAVGGMVLSFIGMGLAATGYLSPVVGALAQEAIDMIAILNALRLTWQARIDTDM